MNNVRSIAKLNEYELQAAIEGSSGGSWHDEYRDSAVIFIGGLDAALTEGDVVTIFSQYGEVLDVNLPKWTSVGQQLKRQGHGNEEMDSTGGSGGGPSKGPTEKQKREAESRVGKRRGFGFLLYQDQRSTILAVDNLNGAVVLNRTLRVDHVKDYKQLEKDSDTGKMREAEQRSYNARPELEADDSGRRKRRSSTASSASSSSNGSTAGPPSIDLEDPMASYLSRQRKSKSSQHRSAETKAAEREAKKQRKEERARIRAERERRKLQSSRSRGEAEERTSERRRDSPPSTQDRRRRECSPYAHEERRGASRRSSSPLHRQYHHSSGRRREEPGEREQRNGYDYDRYEDYRRSRDDGQRFNSQYRHGYDRRR